jgi:hypothetical protein
MRELSLFAFKCTFLCQICLKTHIELWVALIQISHHVTYIYIMTLFQFSCDCRGEKPQVLRAALLLQATRPRLLRMHKEAINYIFQFDSLCTKHLRPNVNWAHFSAAQCFLQSLVQFISLVFYVYYMQACRYSGYIYIIVLPALLHYSSRT